MGGAGGVGEYSEYLSFREAKLTLQDDSSPTIQRLVAPPDGWRAGGVDPVDVAATDNVGIAELTIRGGGLELGASKTRCYDAATNVDPRPCAGSNSTLMVQIPRDSLPEGTQTITVEARDPAGLTGVRTFRLRIDRTAPVAPRELSIDGVAWRSANRFGLSWAAPPSGDVAPLVGNEYAFCPATNAAYDAAGCVNASSTFSDGATTHSVTAPGEGAWMLRVAHRDAAGNTNPANVSAVGPLRFDATPPSGEFEAFDPRDPTRIRVRASDAVSGVARVELEVRREGESAWHALTVGGASGSYSAVLDDSLYPKGSYEVRARVVDQAENERTFTKAPDGNILRVTLPVRVVTTLTAGKAARKGKLDARPVLKFGESAVIKGKLTYPGGNPIAGVPVEVLEQVNAPARPWQSLGTAHTAANGTFTFRVLRGASRTIRFSYGGSPTAQPSSRDVEVRVKAAATIRPDRRKLRNGDEVTFKGRVTSTPIPETGKLVTLQALTRRGWTTFGNARARAKDGRWTYRYRFTGTTVRSRYTFRVLVPAESGYPYAQGASKTTRVLVSP